MSGNTLLHTNGDNSSNSGEFPDLIPPNIEETSGKIQKILDSSNSANSDEYTIIPEELKTDFLARMGENFPSNRIFEKLDIGDSYSSFIFTGIKDMNDTKGLGQPFTNRVLDNFKKSLITYITGNLYKKEKETYGNDAEVPEISIVWNDYKNFVIIPSIGEVSKKRLEKLMERSLSKELTDIDVIGDIPPLGVEFENGTITGESDKKRDAVISSLARTRGNLEKKASDVKYGYLDFSELSQEDLGKDILEFADNNGWIEENSLTGEINDYQVSEGKFYINHDGVSSAYAILNNNGEIHPKILELFQEGKVPNGLKLHDIISKTVYAHDLHMIAEESLISGEGHTFTVERGEATEKYPGYLIIKNGENNTQRVKIFGDDGFFNTSIITMVRKGKIPESMALYKKVKAIIDMLVIDGEFLFPEWEGKGTITSEESLEIENALYTNSPIKKELLQRAYNGYYKGGLSKDAFSEILPDRTGQLFFIDIKDMGSINIRDFYMTLEKVRNGEMTITEAKLQSGSVMTKKFIAIIDNLEKQFSGKKIHYTIGGDEIRLFIEGEVNAGDSASTIYNTITSEGIFGRLTTSKNNQTGVSANDENFDILTELDQNTLYSKEIEKLYSEIELRLLASERKIGKMSKDVSDLLQVLSPHDGESVGETFFNHNAIYQLLNKQKSILETFYNFYIEIDPNGNSENDKIIFIGKGEYLVSSIFDRGTGALLADSPFYHLLDQSGLGRSSDRESSRHQAVAS